MGFSPPSVLPTARPSPLFFGAIGRDAMCFDVTGIDHERVGICAFACKSFENPLEHSDFRPAFVTVAECFGRTVFARTIGPTTAPLEAEDDAGQHATVIGARRVTCWAIAA